MPKTKNNYQWLPVSLWAVLAGILYCSWPLGNYLNPVANRGLASNLEATGQPYNWLFIGLDVLTGILIIIVTIWLLRWVHRLKLPWLRFAIWGYGVFGVLTAVDALLPLDCVSTEQKCGPVLHDPMYIIHGVASIGSIAGLTLSIIAIWWLLARSRHVGIALRGFLHITLLAWFGFGVATAIFIMLDRDSALSQHLFIIVCSLWTAALPYLVWRVLKAMRPQLFTKKVYA